MNIRNILTVLALAASGLSTGCATMAPLADEVTITKRADAVVGCSPAGNVHASPPYNPFVSDPDFAIMRNQAAGLGADRILLTHRFSTADGIAYRCHS